MVCNEMWYYREIANFFGGTIFLERESGIFVEDVIPLRIFQRFPLVKLIKNLATGVKKFKK